MQIFRGTAKKGEGRGTRLGYPTANIALEDTSLEGIYAGTVTVRGKNYMGAIYANQRRHILEAHLLEFWGELYEQDITIELRKKIRDEAQFENEEKLKSAIAADVKAVRDYFNTKELQGA